MLIGYIFETHWSTNRARDGCSEMALAVPVGSSEPSDDLIETSCVGDATIPLRNKGRTRAEAELYTGAVSLGYQMSWLTGELACRKLADIGYLARFRPVITVALFHDGYS
jgi:hypothetical protein